MNNIAIIGFGVLGIQIFNFLKEANGVKKAIAFDDHAQSYPGVDAIFPFERYTEPEFDDFAFYLGIGYKHLSARNGIISELKGRKRSVPSFIHHTSYISPYSRIGEGCILFPKCNIDQNVILEDGNILHNSTVISHDCIIGKCNYFSPSVTVCGNVNAGPENFFGAGSVISNGVVIANASRIGVGSCITKNVGSGDSVIGNPQKFLQKPLNLW
jgi:sugar O-acyltransferase (sialic acid O-acetyltransferase NeuD family)